MNEHHEDLLERARGLAAAKAVIERATAELVAEAIVQNANISAIAATLGIHRSTICRRQSRAPPPPRLHR
jgi:transcriptional regulator of acetoin/glycerol metabolism